ncbi:hypothetical protein Sjap_021508 [Stephania japonica]|uniref:Retrotransposon Copia-like N-terminal domain-containing protein n=1 Tax=Stephania japonica TaxID=461633 RepID=A0AAP0EMK7_9MAGN
MADVQDSVNVEEAITFGVEDVLHLQNSDHLGMVLVTNLLTGQNYLSWSCAILIVLGAKMKNSFVDGRFPKPASSDPLFDRWNKVDCMVTSWISNSISKEIVDAFLYSRIAFCLWIELKERFGECNGPQMYQLKREIVSISQGNHSISKYYTNLKKLWDELNCLAPIPRCDCGVSSKFAEMDSNDKLMQFLMGLSDSYDHVRNQILVMNPLPSINKAYSMIVRVEKQRDVHVAFMLEAESAMMIKVSRNNRNLKKMGDLRNQGVLIKIPCIVSFVR